MYRITRPAAICVAFLAPVASFGQAFVSDSFTGPPGAIGGRGGGTGFESDYRGEGAVVSPGLDYPGLLTSGNRFDTTGAHGLASRAFPRISTDFGTLFVGFLAAATATAPRDDFAGISLLADERLTVEVFLGKERLSPNYGFNAYNGDSSRSAANAPVSTTPTLLVYRFTFTQAGDTIDMFVNPTPGGLLPETPAATFAIPESTFRGDEFSAIMIQSGTGNPFDASPPFSFDELRIGRSFADVAPVPEPAAAGLLYAAGLLARRRRA